MKNVEWRMKNEVEVKDDVRNDANEDVKRLRIKASKNGERDNEKHVGMYDTAHPNLMKAKTYLNI